VSSSNTRGITYLPGRHIVNRKGYLWVGNMRLAEDTVAYLRNVPFQPVNCRSRPGQNYNSVLLEIVITGQKQSFARSRDANMYN